MPFRSRVERNCEAVHGRMIKIAGRGPGLNVGCTWRALRMGVCNEVWGNQWRLLWAVSSEHEITSAATRRWYRALGAEPAAALLLPRRPTLTQFVAHYSTRWRRSNLDR